MRIDQQVKEIKRVGLMTVFLFLFLIIISIMISRLSLGNIIGFKLSDTTIVNNKDNQVVFTGDNVAKIYNTQTGSVEKVDIEEYIKCVVASEMPVNFSEEALKAQAIAARTFYYSKRLDNCKQGKGAEICNSTHCQVYEPKEECLKKWDAKDQQANWDKISSAVDATKDMILTYKGQIVNYPQYFSTSWGKTESAKEVLSQNIPYLKSTESEGEQVAPKYTSTVNLDYSNFITTLESKYKNTGLNTKNLKDEVKIISNNQSGSVKEIQLGNKKITGRDFRTLFGLNSPDFTISVADSVVSINCKGYGHGLGMSQWGANIMGKNGSSFKEILKHYYSGVEIGIARIKD